MKRASRGVQIEEEGPTPCFHHAIYRRAFPGALMRPSAAAGAHGSGGVSGALQAAGRLEKGGKLQGIERPRARRENRSRMRGYPLLQTANRPTAKASEVRAGNTPGPMR